MTPYGVSRIIFTVYEVLKFSPLMVILEHGEVQVPKLELSELFTTRYTGDALFPAQVDWVKLMTALLVEIEDALRPVGAKGFLPWLDVLPGIT